MFWRAGLLVVLARIRIALTEGAWIDFNVTPQSYARFDNSTAGIKLAQACLLHYVFGAYTEQYSFQQREGVTPSIYEVWGSSGRSPEPILIINAACALQLYFTGFGA